MEKKETQESGIIQNRKMMSKITEEICTSAGWNEDAIPYVEVAVATVLCDSDRTLEIVFDSQKNETEAKCWSHANMYELISLALRTAYYDETGDNETPSKEWLDKNVCGTTVENIIVGTCTALIFSTNIIESVVEFQKNMGAKFWWQEMNV